MAGHTGPVKRSVALISLGSAIAIAGAAAALVVRLALEERSDPARCSEPLVAIGPRCCAKGQGAKSDHCAGVPTQCGAGMHLAQAPEPGCAADERRIPYPGGRQKLFFADWEEQGETARELRSGAFELDWTEVTIERWRACVDAEMCRAVRETEPGRPVTGINAEEAARFCLFAGGRLPTGDEWLMAAAGASARRFPWGPTGLVCRRAVFGLVDGPCADGATGPELAGSRPDGASPEGALDLSGNVAEWTRERDGRHVARGGSFHSKAAAELKSWSAVDVRGGSPDVGFRCAYDAGPARR